MKEDTSMPRSLRWLCSSRPAVRPNQRRRPIRIDHGGPDSPLHLQLGSQTNLIFFPVIFISNWCSSCNSSLKKCTISVSTKDSQKTGDAVNLLGVESTKEVSAGICDDDDSWGQCWDSWEVPQCGRFPELLWPIWCICLVRKGLGGPSTRQTDGPRQQTGSDVMTERPLHPIFHRLLTTVRQRAHVYDISILRHCLDETGGWESYRQREETFAVPKCRHQEHKDITQRM